MHPTFAFNAVAWTPKGRFGGGPAPHARREAASMEICRCVLQVDTGHWCQGEGHHDKRACVANCKHCTYNWHSEDIHHHYSSHPDLQSGGEALTATNVAEGGNFDCLRH